MNDQNETLSLAEVQKVKRLAEIRLLIEQGNAGMTESGKIVDIRNHPSAEKISTSSPQARQLIFLAAVMGIREELSLTS